MRRLLLLASVATASAVVAAPTYATTECRGLQVCVPVTGPWVLASPGRVEFQLACPKRFVVGGLDAELSTRAIDIGFVGNLGSPVNPGITTSKEAVFLGRLVRGSDPAASFRPHIGCVPASGGGQRTPTAYHVFKPGKPSIRHVTNIVVHAQGTTRFVRILPSGGRDVTMAIVHGLSVEDEVAERLKRGEEVEGAPPQEEVRRVAMQRAGSFVDEIRSSLEFYTAQAQGARIGKVLITGGGSKLNGFLDLLRERIPVSVEAGSLFQRLRSQLSLSEEALAEAEPVLVVATGLALPGRPR